MKKLLLTLLTLPTLWLSATAQTLPTADEVINKYIAAIGGKDALMKVKDLTSVGTMVYNNSSIQITLKRKAPAKSLTLLTGDNGQLFYKNVIDGTNVVDITQQGTTRQNEQAARLSLMYNRLFPELVFNEQGIKSTVVGKEQIDGQDAYKVTNTFADGTPLWTSYYDVITGLKVQHVIKWDQNRTATLKSSNYKEVNGVKIPHNSTYQENDGVVSMSKVNSVQINTGVSDTEFAVQ
ncbi:hypothetical protein BN8_06436 [Fibrisoma limi BUZ 3]|uniref:Outer membrane lipoprotein-sorting protein n=1 Tax=Fibrisoma limi BUZ 3 TaxID=1185876 RepID=I2GT08_9BACT|nr:hypothetical protein [Fibrisoma limi]CCH57037.1 hypothetical protein BN8_06436 [Fibrisoma limi BUZ 3]